MFLRVFLAADSLLLRWLGSILKDLGSNGVENRFISGWRKYLENEKKYESSDDLL